MSKDSMEESGTYPLNARQEHYLKRELLKFQLEHEFQQLNEKEALRTFGYPFSSTDPKELNKNASKFTKTQKDDRSGNLETSTVTDFPMLSYLLREFIMTFPLFAKNVSIDEAFWQTKVQVFFEHFTDLGFSDSFDLEHDTKRKKLGQKFTKLILLLFNSGLGTKNEVTYYEVDKKFSLNKDTRKRSKIEEFTIPTREGIRDLITNEPVYINSWDVNVVAIIHDSTLQKITPLVNASTLPSSSTSSLYSVNPLKSTSRWVKDTFAVQSSTTSLFSKLSLNGSTNNTTVTSSSVSVKDTIIAQKKSGKKHFILKIKRPETSEAVYVVKPYTSFKNLAADLVIQFPGKKLPRIPHKIKKRSQLHKVRSTTSISSKKSISSNAKNESSIQITPSIDESFADEDELLDQDKEGNAIEDDDEDFGDIEFGYDDLMDDKLRTSLRQYIRSLCDDEEISLSSPLIKFFDSDKIAKVDDLRDSEIRIDMKRRENIDISNLETQLDFQKLALERSLILQDSMKEFKNNLLKDDDYLLGLAHEIKEKTSIKDLSPIFQDFIEWFKIYFASLIFQTFIGHDNSYGFYTQIRRLHKLMPYTMMEQIVRFTNPMAMMKGLIDLFMAQPPQLLGGGQSLLQTMFSTILTDDLRIYKNRVKDQENLIIKESDDTLATKTVIKCLRSFVLDKEDGKKLFTMQDVHEEATTMNMPAVLIVLMKCDDLKLISNSAVTQVIESYTTWKINADNGSMGISVGNNSTSPLASKEDGSLYFQRVKELFILYIKEHDKRLMRQLWQDSELLALLKAIVTLVYEPMVRLFKVAKMDVALRNFEKFMTDLIKLLDMIIDGRAGASTQFNVIDSIYNLITKHQDSFFEFLHDIYINDTEQIFEGFILWFGKIIKFLQTSKYGSEKQRTDLNALLLEAQDDLGVDIDIDLLKKQIDEVIAKKSSARKVYKEIVDLRTQNDSSNLKGNQKGVSIETNMKKKWSEINGNIMPESTMNAGLGDGDLVDLDIDTKDLDSEGLDCLKDADGTDLEAKYHAILEQEIDESEIHKFTDKYTRDILKCTLGNI
ncbi:similar to Saccharomyces cerevisiae YPR097W Protein that contains a Phox homology (PX) domain and binds phosphoinositides [Maudiozyma saulgeensis]|uniref:Similar to Saccharomyces cerevisiae YPR097W Protein that contains a Phox homology (PX) domain and binds phosphoinositides n=1 Tax=Maudiozyma saulgeensis TaxID=1789683 RepID=A0A1X7QXT1_9SACH|nr:similar to Saccharomyces cerevisiae YPR097W Protein that contains a Phox homology (PX) domain and binds phosphoinositides [Kazachstania saulgeensis]